MQKNDEIIVTIQNLGANGEGVAIVDGYPIFVPNALTNEQVKIKILKPLKNFAYAKLLEVITPSPDRVQPVCLVFTKCGGCQLQHLNYLKQLEFKQNLVETNFKKFAGIEVQVLPCVASQNQYGYRNKFQLPIGVAKQKIGDKIEEKNVVGLYAKSSNRIVPTMSCDLQGKWATDLICIALKYLEISGDTAFDSTMQTGNVRHFVARKMDNSIMLTVVTKSGKLKDEKTLISLVSKSFPNCSIFINKNSKNTNVVLGEEFKHIFGSETQKLCTFNINYEVSPQSFLQVNFDVQNKIYKEVLENISQDSSVINAYSGAGLLSAIISQKAKWVYGIEIVEPATKNADKLKCVNNIQNMTNITGDCAIELPKLVNKISTDNLTVVLDPPRKGCDSKVLEAISAVKPSKILYVSCNSATLARDVKLLLNDGNYQIDYIKPFDMFPQTCHVETFACLKLKG